MCVCVCRYGEQAGTVVDDSLSTAGHVANLTAVSTHYPFLPPLSIPSSLINVFLSLFLPHSLSLLDILELEDMGYQVSIILHSLVVS